jgi:eukaryotic-like serine/threonine-protein kinase
LIDIAMACSLQPIEKVKLSVSLSHGFSPHTPSRGRDGDVACPSCGTAFSAETRFCPKDGTPLYPQGSEDAQVLPNFEFDGEIGCGGMGVVYKARHTVLNKWFAIKMLPFEHLDRVGVRRFQQEARAASSLQHENVVVVHDCGVTASGRPYMVMEYAPGETLSELLRRKGHLSVVEAVPIFVEICAGVQHAHANGILHRDLKPSNIVLVDTGTALKVKILDFGIAKILDDEVRLEKGLTQTGEVFGSPPYMSPEQALGRTSDRRTDIYSLGCLMYEVLTGAPPIVGQSVIETIYRQIHDVPPSLREASLGLEFPQALEDIIAKTLAKNMDDRFSTVEELKQELSRLEKGSSDDDATPRLNKSKISKTFAHPVAAMAITAWIFLSFVAYPWLHRGLVESKSDSRSIVGSSNGSATAKPVSGATPISGATTVTGSTRGSGQTSVSDSADVTGAMPASGPTAGAGPTAVSDPAPAPRSARQDLDSIYSLDGLPLSADEAAWQTITRMARKTSFEFRGTRLTNRGLLAFLHRDDVTDLRVASTRISDEGIKSIAHLPLTALDLGYTGVTNAGLKTISSTTTLRELHIDGLRITDNGLVPLLKLKVLSDLFVGSNFSLTDRSWFILSKMKSLEVLDLSRNETSEDGLTQLRSLPLLKKLNLSDMKITDKSGEVIGHCSHITSLSVNHTQIGDAFVIALDPLALEHLELSGNRIDDKALRNLPNQKHLHTLMLREQRRGITDEGVALIAKLPKLNVLYLDEDKGLTDGALKYLGRCRSLSNLSLRGVPITNVGVKYLEGLSKLSRLDLCGTGITDAGVDSILKHDLTDLTISYTTISAQGFLRLAHMKNLRHLFVTYNPKISPKALAEFGRQLPSCVLHVHAGPYTDAAQVKAGVFSR